LETEGNGRVSEAARELEQSVINQTEGIDSADEVRVVRDGDKLQAELTSQGDRSMQDFQEDQVAQQVIESTEGIDERSEVDVIQRGDSFEAQLTEEGQQARQTAVEQEQRDAIADMGTTGRSFLARQVAQEAGVTRSDVDVDVQESSVEVGLSESGVERAAQRQQAAFASDVRTNQFARQQLREEFAGETEDLQTSDVDVDVTRSGVNVGLTEGGETRQAVASAAENSEFTRDELTATVNEDGETRVQLTDDALVERVASDNEDVSADELRVVEREFQGASERRPGYSQRVIELTDDAAAQRRLEQAREENPNANFGLTEGEDGTPRVEVQERFDDNGRFLLIPGAEDDVEAAADVTGEFLGGVGQRVGTAVGAVPDFVGESVGVTDRNDISDVTRTAGRGFGTALNVPGLLVSADEAGEFIGAAGAASVNSALEGNTDEIAEFGQEGTAAGTFLGTQVVENAQENPVDFTARLGGAAVGTAGLFRLAGPASSTSGQLARGVIQPGEEALAAVGLRPSTVARSAAGSARRGISDASLPGLSGGRLSEARAQAPSVTIGRGEGAVNVQTGVRESASNAVSTFRPELNLRSRVRSDASLSDRIGATREAFRAGAQSLELEARARRAAASEAISEFDLGDALSRPDGSSVNVRDAVRARAQSEVLNARAAVFNARRRIENTDLQSSTPDVDEGADAAGGLVRGGVLSARAGLFNARRRIENTDLRSSAPDVDEGRDAVGGLVRGGVLSARAGLFNARSRLGSAELSDVTPDSSLSDVTDLRLEVERGRPPRRDRTIDASNLDIDADDLPSELNFDTSRFDADADARTDTTVDSDFSQPESSSQQLTVEARSETSTRTDASTNPTRFEFGDPADELSPATEIEFGATGADVAGELGVDDDLGVNDESVFTPTVSPERDLDDTLFEPATNAFDVSQSPGLEGDLGIDTSPGVDTRTPVDTRVRIDTDPALDTNTRLGLESAIDIDTRLDYDTRFRTDTPRRPPTPTLNRDRDPFNSDDDLGMDSAEDVFGTGFRDFDI
jgi:hypothetical protein